MIFECCRWGSVVETSMRSGFSNREFETPHGGVSTISREAGVLRITVPALVPGATLVFVAFWLILWSVAGLVALSSLLGKLVGGYGAGPSLVNGSSLFLAVWCVLWVFGEVYATKYVFWGLFGREDIIVSQSGLEHRKTCLGISRSKSYQVSIISRFRTAPAVSNKLRGEGDDNPVPDASSISFDYGSKSVIMASGMDDAEATRIVEEVRRFNSLLKPRE